jgi:hypothetical protein
MRAGGLLLALGLLLDVVYHGLSALGVGDASHSGVVATAVHGVVLAGMVVTFGGLLQVAFRPQVTARRKETQ